MMAPIHILYSENGRLERDNYLEMWKSIAQEHFHEIPQIPMADADLLQRKLQANNIFYIARRTVQQLVKIFLSENFLLMKFF